MNQLDSILLIDDNDEINFLHKLTINLLNISGEVFIKSNCRDALEFLKQRYFSRERLPSLILLDLLMPGMSGFDFLRELGALDIAPLKDIPVVIVTISDDAKDRAEARRLGNYMYVSKPLTEEKIIKIVESLSSHDTANVSR